MSISEQLSICRLIIERRHGGRAGVYLELEPLEARDIVGALEKRTGKSLVQAPDAWAKWFLNEPAVGTPQEKRSLTAHKDKLGSRNLGRH